MKVKKLEEKVEKFCVGILRLYAYFSTQPSAGIYPIHSCYCYVKIHRNAMKNVVLEIVSDLQENEIIEFLFPDSCIMKRCI